MAGRILYLDDEQPLVFLMTRMLTHLGHRVAGFTSGKEAIEAFRASPGDFDLVLTDMSMPHMSGLEFAQEILKIAPQARVVIATGCIDPNWAGHARSCGVHEVIEKPGSVADMSQVVTRLLTAGT
jgi:two-component system, cell cycle sensor histidine kinase and response regulator CckA